MKTAARLFTVSAASRAAVAQPGRHRSARLPIVPEAPDPVFFRADARGRWHESCCGSASTESVASCSMPGASARTRTSRRCSTRTPQVASGRRRRRSSCSWRSRARDVRLCCGRASAVESTRSGSPTHVLLPGFVPDDTLACLYTAATAVALPSLAEGFGLPAVEAAACGAPVLLSDLPAHRESLGDGGLYFAARDPAALAAALATMLDDEAARTALAIRGSAAVAELTWDAAAERLRDLLHEAAGPVSGSSLSFCMVTTFYPPHNFGGDGIYVHRLSNELARRGHRVTVVSAPDAHRAAGWDRGCCAGRAPERDARADRTPLGLGLAARHLPLRSSRTAGAPARRAFRAGALRRHPLPQRLARGRTRRPRLRRRRQALHDARALARLPDAHALAARPRALRAADLPALHARLPPSAAALALQRRCSSARRAHVDLFLSPEPIHDSRRTGERGFDRPMRHLPLLHPPDDAAEAVADARPEPDDRTSSSSRGSRSSRACRR